MLWLFTVYCVTHCSALRDKNVLQNRVKTIKMFPQFAGLWSRFIFPPEFLSREPRMRKNGFSRHFNIFVMLSEDFPFDCCMFAGLDQHPVTVTTQSGAQLEWVRHHCYICWTSISLSLSKSPSHPLALLVECLLGNPEQTAAVCSVFVNDGFLLTSTIDNRSTPVGLTQAG